MDVASLRVPIERFSEAAESIRFDGTPFSALNKRLRWPPEVEDAPSRPFSELLIAFTTLVSMGVHKAEVISRGRPPDFEVRIGNCRWLLECSSLRKEKSAHFNVTLDRLNDQIRYWVLSDREVEQHIANSAAEIVLDTNVLTSNYDALLKEVRNFIVHTPLASTSTDLSAVPDAFPLLHASNAKLIRSNARGLNHFAVRSAPQWSSSEDLRSLIYHTLNRKRKIARSWPDLTPPLILSLYITEQATLLQDTLRRIERRMAGMQEDDIAPFQSVLLGDQNEMLAINASGLLDSVASDR